ncbi:hypothetical protein VMCG_06733 [Cytospora schulzeri]|uniref:Uncharacterized protein n=1 Tax=Cytospora schulzeri TaxID=448051 RepID=A0A423W5S4_9PEZI|nr:hypothetical protein VMCG_06733 [Valsa malicola]
MDLQRLEQTWSARLRDEKALAEGKKAELIHAFRGQMWEEHQAEFAVMDWTGLGGDCDEDDG